MNTLNQLVIPKKSERTSTAQLKRQYEFYQQMKIEEIQKLSEGKMISRITSEANWLVRSKYASCVELGIHIRIGDICFVDFGDEAYLYESGYQHFAVILSFCHGKAFVIPMTSNPMMVHQAYDEQKTPEGKKHLMRIGLIEGMTKESVLFLNDGKFINTARIIDVKANINKNSELFQEIKKRLKECMKF